MNKYCALMILLAIGICTPVHAETKITCYKKLASDFVCKENGGSEWKWHTKLTGETV